jgi:excisionase family DNA binding protein
VKPAPPTRLAYNPDEAAALLGVSRSFFFANVLPELRVVRCGRRRLISQRELERWLDTSASRISTRDNPRRN